MNCSGCHKIVARNGPLWMNNCPIFASIEFPFYSDAPEGDLCLLDVASERLLIEHAVQRAGNVLDEGDVDQLGLKPIEREDDGDDLALVRVIMVQSPMEAMEWRVDCYCCYCLHLLLPMYPMFFGLFAHRSIQDL